MVLEESELEKIIHDIQKTDCDRGERQTVTYKKSIPQGRVLGPILVFLYMNDLVLELRELDLADFADDINISVVSEWFNELSQITTEDWFSKNRLTLNKEKIQYTSSGTLQRTNPESAEIDNGQRILTDRKFLAMHINQNWH